MRELVSVKDQDFYKRLLSECRPIADDLDKKRWQLVLVYHKLGSTIKRYENEGLMDRRYGDETIKALAQDLNMNHTIIYRAIRLVEIYPTVENLKQFKEAHESGGTRLTWTYVRENILPKARKADLKERFLDQLQQIRLMYHIICSFRLFLDGEQRLEEQK